MALHSSRYWPAHGAVPATDLVDLRLQCHHAAQIVVSVGVSLLPAKPDDSHTNLEWLTREAALAGRLAPARHPFRAALRIKDLTLLMCDADGVSWAQYPLGSHTVAEAMAWLAQRITDTGGEADKLTPKKHYAIPDHPVASGGRFTPTAGTAASAFMELGAYYAGADFLLRELEAVTEGASEVRCWPHHFDLATLISLPGNPAGRTVGAGLSPGDDSYPEPYYYVTPYPYPPSRTQPGLPAGRWHTAGWFGAVLRGSDFAPLPGADAQQSRVKGFLEAAVAACREMLA